MTLDVSNSLVDLLPVGFLVLDDAGTLTQANQPALEWLGLDAGAVGRQGLAEVVQDETLRNLLSSPGAGFVRMNVAQGERTLHAELRPEPEGDGRVLILQDVTGFDHLVQTRRRFVFDLLHKLRTPLTTIKSVLSMATSGRIDPAKVDVSELLGMGVKQTERLNGLLSRLKDLFLLETGTMREEMQIRSAALEVAVSEALRSLAPRFEERKIEVNERYPHESVPVLADLEVLTRVVEMVLTNACVHCPEGTPVTVLVDGDATHARLVVSDTGPGIPPEDLAQVFERFRRGSTEASRNAEGEGLGLYLSRQLLLLMDGTIVAESEPGRRGTTVEITLRVPEEEA